jgi:Opioid growth factor receptor (OGFr) conserved region
VSFYRGEVVHPDRLTLDEIIRWDDKEIENSHSIIQWLFPLNKPSLNVANTPVITEHEIKQFRSDPELRNGVLRSLARMLRFYGLRMATPDMAIVKGKDFEQKSGWIYPRNHNYKRLTRMLKSLRLLGFEAEAKCLYAALEEIYNAHRRYIGQEVFEYWQRAIDGTEKIGSKKETT